MSRAASRLFYVQVLAVLFRHTLRKKHRQLCVNAAPILPSSGPFFGDIYGTAFSVGCRLLETPTWPWLLCAVDG